MEFSANELAELTEGIRLQNEELERLRAFAECVLSLADTVKNFGFKDVDIDCLYRYAVKHGITAEPLKAPE